MSIAYIIQVAQVCTIDILCYRQESARGVETQGGYQGGGQLGRRNQGPVGGALPTAPAESNSFLEEGPSGLPGG